MRSQLLRFDMDRILVLSYACADGLRCCPGVKAAADALSLPVQAGHEGVAGKSQPRRDEQDAHAEATSPQVLSTCSCTNLAAYSRSLMSGALRIMSAELPALWT